MLVGIADNVGGGICLCLRLAVFKIQRKGLSDAKQSSYIWHVGSIEYIFIPNVFRGYWRFRRL